MPTFKSNVCPVCSSRNLKIIGPAEIGTLPLGQGPTNIVQCISCSSYYTNPMPFWSKDEFNILYGIDYFKENSSNSIYNKLYDKLHNDNLIYRLSIITKYLISRNNSFLEFGAGIQARMAKFLSKKSWGSISIQEPSKEFSAVLKINNPNIEIINKDFLSIKEIKYSLIYADSVLEHTPNPIDYIRNASNLLYPGGCLYLVVPNEHSLFNYLTTIYYKIMRKNNVKYLCPYSVTYHLVGFSKKGIESMAEECGLELVYHLKGRDHSWVRISNLNKSPFIKYPAAFILSLADFLGFGVNQEFLLRKL
jgi:SAM-dependent methyltransferase